MSMAPPGLNSSRGSVNGPPGVGGAYSPAGAPGSGFDEVVTAYVGKIAKGIPDDMVRRFLECCGRLDGWTRTINSFTGDLNSFGYAKFASIAGVLTALRLLNGYSIQGQELMIKIDDKTREKCDQYEQLHTDLAAHDDDIMQKLDLHLREFRALAIGDDLDRDDPTMKAVPSVAGDKEKANIVNNEIRRFRDQQVAMERERQERQEKQAAAMVEADRDRARRRERQTLQMRDDRLREIDAELRQKDRGEQDYRDAERRWEKREIHVQREKERIVQDRADRQRHRQDDMEREYDDFETWRRHVKDSYRRRERRREADRDKTESERERHDEERRAREEEERQRREREQEEQRRLDEERTQAEKAERKAAEEPVAIKLGASAPKKRAISDILEEEGQEDDSLPEAKKRVLVKLDYSEIGLMTDEDKRNNPEIDKDLAQRIIAHIPAEKEDLFAFPVKWDIVQAGDVLEKKIRPWLATKVGAYVDGDEELAKEMEKFILLQLNDQCSASQLQEELQGALGDDTELFVKLLWRMLNFHVLAIDPAFSKN